MGGSDSKSAEAVDNKGMLNGNSINNGILENFEIVKTELFILNAFHAVVVLILLLKYFVKYIKKSSERAQRIDNFPQV